MANITDVAKKAGVSISTVSHVINGTKFVGEELTDRVNRAIAELGYQANEMAASMKRRTTNNIGVILPNIGMVFFPDVLKGIEEAAREQGYRLFYFSTDYDFQKEQEYLHLLKTSWVDGIILDSCCPREQLEEYRQALVSDAPGRRVPVVALEAPFAPEGLGVITFDEVKFTREAMAYLLDRGHRRIRLLLGPAQIPMYANNLRGCRQALEARGLELRQEDILTGDYFAESGYLAVKAALETGEPFTAILAANDQMAIGAMKAIKEAGKRIPQDIAVIGADGIYVTTLIQPSLTTVELPRYEMGYRAGKLLAEMIQDPGTAGQSIRLEGKLVIRRSTDPGAQENWELTGW